MFSLVRVLLQSYRPWAASGGPGAPFLHVCPPFPPQKQVDLSSSLPNKGSKRSLLSSHPKKSKPLSYVLQEYLDFETWLSPLEGSLSVDKPFGSSSQRRKESGAGPLLLPFTLQWWRKGLWAFLQASEKDREAGANASLEGTRDERWQIQQAEEAHWVPGGLRSKARSRTWETTGGLKMLSWAPSAAPRMHLCPDLISDCVLKPRGSSDPPQVQRQNPQAPRPWLRLLFPPAEHPGWEKLFLPRSGPHAEIPISAVRCTPCSNCL